MEPKKTNRGRCIHAPDCGSDQCAHYRVHNLDAHCRTPAECLIARGRGAAPIKIAGVVCKEIEPAKPLEARAEMAFCADDDPRQLLATLLRGVYGS